jgi:hypothetical protein
MGLGDHRHVLAALPPRKEDPVPIVQETGWSRGHTFHFLEQTVVLQLIKKFFVMESENSSSYSYNVIGCFPGMLQASNCT